jgi:hypothetical protein
MEKIIRTVSIKNQAGIELDRININDFFNFEEGDPSIEEMNNLMIEEAEKKASLYEQKVNMYFYD